jgi:DNA-binding NtrC family response regulator
MRPKSVTGPAIELLMSYDWRRNNVRELRNVLERMLIASGDDTVGPEDVPPEIRDDAAAERVRGGAPARTFHELKAEAERRIIVTALERNGWHITRTAETLGLADHASLLKIMRRHGISRA